MCGRAKAGEEETSPDPSFPGETSPDPSFPGETSPRPLPEEKVLSCALVALTAERGMTPLPEEAWPLLAQRGPRGDPEGAQGAMWWMSSLAPCAAPSVGSQRTNTSPLMGKWLSPDTPQAQAGNHMSCTH